jgi:parvulin-like peptidyl-prolyl isomerase
MKFSKRTNTIVLWLISIGLLVGMVISFTPSLGFGGGGSINGPVAMRVNGEPVYEFTFSQARQNPLYHRVTEGEVGADLQLLLVDSVVTQEILQQAAARVRVSNSEVAAEVREFRETQGVAGSRNDSSYLQVLGSAGFDDQSFRAYLKDQLRQQKWEDSLVGNVTVNDTEVQTYYDAFMDGYRTEDRIRARMINVADADLAAELRSRIEAGESVADLAAEYSLDRADRHGALGAPAGSSEPLPVGRAALPPAVANAAFNLRSAGLTPVVSADNLYWLVAVEEFEPSEVKLFAEVADEVREDALQSKKVGIISKELNRLVHDAKIEIPADSEIVYNNPVVATVGADEIRAADLARATYGNAQTQQFLSPETAFLIEQLIKPQIMEQLIEQKLAYLGSAELAGTFVGTEAQVAQEALDFVARDVTVSEEDISEYYEQNRSSFVVSASAEVFSYEFADFDTASSFRTAVLSGTAPLEAAEDTGATVEDLGTLVPGAAEPVLDLALFSTDAFEALPDSQREVSGVLFVEGTMLPADGDAEAAEGTAEAAAGTGNDAEAAGAAADAADATATGFEGTASRYLVLIAARTPERTRTFDEVRDQVRDTLLFTARSETQQAWLAELQQDIPVVNVYAAAREEGLFDFTVPEQDAADDAGAADAAAGDATAAPEAEAEAEPAAEPASDN